MQIMPSAKASAQIYFSPNLMEFGGGAPEPRQRLRQKREPACPLGSPLKLWLALVAVVGKASPKGGELEQNLGGTEGRLWRTLKNIQDSLQPEAYKNMGLSASDYGTANKMGSLFQGSGWTSEITRPDIASMQACSRRPSWALDTSMANGSIAGAAIILHDGQPRRA